MLRVWKKFFKKVLPPIGYALSSAAFILGCAYGAEYIGMSWNDGFLVGVGFVVIGIPTIAVLYIAFDIARKEVHQENKELMEKIKNGKERDAV